MKKKKILVVLGHPRVESLCGELVDAYASGAGDAGHDVRVIKLGEHAIDWNLLEGINTGENEEPEWSEWRDDVMWSDHLVFVFPTWRYTVPAILKGWFDRLLIPKFSHQYTGYLRWKKLLSGKTASMYTTCGGPRWVYWFLGGHPGLSWLKKTMWFVGIKPKKRHYFTKLAPGLRSEDEIRRMIEKMRRFGERGR